MAFRHLLFVALFALAPIASGAQRINPILPSGSASDRVTLVGVVRDPNDRPLSAAEVMIDGESRAITNTRGEFTIPDLAPGMLTFTTRRIGYRPTTTDIQIEPGLRVTLSVKLIPAAVQLGTIVVEGKVLDRSLWQTGFYQRQLAGTGYFFDADYMRHFQAGLGALVRSVPTVSVERGETDRRDPVAYGKSANGSPCPLNVFVDGRHVPWATTMGIDQVVNTGEILAVEIYPRAQQMPARISGRFGGVPVTINVTESGVQVGQGFVECGAIVLWTKPFETRR